MTTRDPPSPDHDLGRLHRGLATARDVQIAKVVAVVDALEARGAADEVIAPLRPRLAQMRPRRPLRFSRLLFMPLDPLIVPPQDWRPNSPTIPRTALPPLAETVRVAMGSEARGIDAMIWHHSADDVEAACAAGAILWPRAGGILAEASDAIGWMSSGLPADACVPLSRQVAALLMEAGSLEALYAEAAIGVSLQPEQLRPLMRNVSTQPPDTLAMMVTLLLARLPETLGVLDRVASALGPNGNAQMRVATERAIEVLLDRLEASRGIESLVIANSLGQAGAEVRHIADLLHALPADGSRLHWRARQQTITHRLDATCRLRLNSALDGEFAEALGRVTADGDSDAMDRLEDAARDLRGLEQVARQVGGEEIYDSLLQRAASLVKEPAPRDSLGLIDRVRLIEILSGPEEALAMLDAAEALA